MVCRERRRVAPRIRSLSFPAGAVNLDAQVVHDYGLPESSSPMTKIGGRFISRPQTKTPLYTLYPQKKTKACWVGRVHHSCKNWRSMKYHTAMFKYMALFSQCSNTRKLRTGSWECSVPAGMFPLQSMNCRFHILLVWMFLLLGPTLLFMHILQFFPWAFVSIKSHWVLDLRLVDCHAPRGPSKSGPST